MGSRKIKPEDMLAAMARGKAMNLAKAGGPKKGAIYWSTQHHDWLERVEAHCQSHGVHAIVHEDSGNRVGRMKPTTTFIIAGLEEFDKLDHRKPLVPQIAAALLRRAKELQQLAEVLPALAEDSPPDS